MKKLLVIATALTLTLTPLSATAQLDPRTKPVKRGPLTFDGDTYPGRDCKKGRFRRHGDSGRVTSYYRFCTFFYRYSPAEDNNSNRNFGAIWFATRVNPTNGWCAKRVLSKIGVQTSGPAKVHNRAPAGKTIGTNDSKKVKTKLVVDADGDGSANGVLKKNFILYPDELKIRRFKKDGFTNLLLDWRGRTKKTVSFASAVEMSWRQGESPPSIFPQLRSLHVKPCSN
ncbi:MAG: hypothetical protein ACRDK3_15330 [Actinomycetota bacterium]